MAVNKLGIVSTDCFSVTKPINFKKLYLYFDELLVDLYLMDISFQMFPKDPVIKKNGDEMMGLAKRGMIKFMTSRGDDDLKADFSQFNDIPAELKNLPDTLIALNLGKTIHYARNFALKLQAQGVDIAPIYNSTEFLDSKYENSVSGKKSEVTRFIFSQLPEPDEDVSWEQLIEFKSDPATSSKFYRMITWINEISKENMSISEIRDRFYAMYYDYQHQFNIHKMKYSIGTAEVLITAMSEALSGKLSAIGSTLSLLSVKKQQLLLTESEMTIPGKELAYIFEVNKQLKSY